MIVNAYACFIDERKAFDCVNYQRLIEIQKSTGNDKGDLRIITELYWHQTIEVKMDQLFSESILVKRESDGVVCYHHFCSIYTLETIFTEALDGIEGEIKINGKVINSIRYAVDTVVMANDIHEL